MKSFNILTRFNNIIVHKIHTSNICIIMAHTKWDYVRSFETNNDKLLPNSWAIARIDGRGMYEDQHINYGYKLYYAFKKNILRF